MFFTVFIFGSTGPLQMEPGPHDMMKLNWEPKGEGTGEDKEQGNSYWNARQHKQTRLKCGFYSFFLLLQDQNQYNQLISKPPSVQTNEIFRPLDLFNERSGFVPTSSDTLNEGWIHLVTYASSVSI